MEFEPRPLDCSDCKVSGLQHGDHNSVDYNLYSTFSLGMKGSTVGQGNNLGKM